MATHTITQGADCTILVTGVLDRLGVPLDPTGWVVVAQLRRHRDAPLLAEWRTSPTGGQGRATTDALGVYLDVPAAMSELWTWDTATLHVEIAEPAPGTRQARVGEATLHLDPAIVTS